MCQHFTVVTSVLQILIALRVMFRVHVYWSGSDTYPVFRTRFSLCRAYEKFENDDSQVFWTFMRLITKASLLCDTRKTKKIKADC